MQDVRRFTRISNTRKDIIRRLSGMVYELHAHDRTRFGFAAPHDFNHTRILRIETIPLRVKLDRPATGSTLRLTHRATIVTRVHTDAGLVGECFNGNDDELQGQIIRMIHDEMEPRPWWAGRWRACRKPGS